MGIALDKAVAISILSFSRALFVGIIGGIIELLNLLFTKNKKSTEVIEEKPIEI